jgi:hypothetical protein
MNLEFFTVLPLASMLYVGIAGVVVSAIGAGVAFTGAQQQAAAAEQQGKDQQAAANASAANAEQQAAENIRRERINKRRRLARLRSSMNAGGVLMSDSSMDVFAETAGREELALQDTARESNMDAANTRNSGNIAGWEARALARATRVSSYGNLLSDSSKIATSAASNPAFAKSGE